MQYKITEIIIYTKITSCSSQSLRKLCRCTIQKYKRIKGGNTDKNNQPNTWNTDKTMTKTINQTPGKKEEHSWRVGHYFGCNV